MRLILALALLPLPAAAWEFSPDPMCTLTHQAEDAEIAITYDSAVPQYTLFITLRSGEWPDAAGFQMILWRWGRRYNRYNAAQFKRGQRHAHRA